MSEWIVELGRGVDEPTARALAARHGLVVRRRMRADSPDDVVLLVRTDAATLDPEFERHPQVRRVEPSSPSYGVR